jgi:hypothetical protein
MSEYVMEESAEMTLDWKATLDNIPLFSSFVQPRQISLSSLCRYQVAFYNYKEL